VEIARCQRLVKGYSDTHARGEGNFEKIMEVIGRLGGKAAPADVVRRLRNAALADEEGKKLASEIAALEN
jgi:indolepyruvate ferredoxin oxidoreductase beta subunit